MKVLILGSTGMLGRALVAEAQKRDIQPYGMSKESTDFTFNITDDKTLEDTIFSVSPSVIINTVAIIDHNYCEKNPAEAYLVNARPASVIACAARKIGAYFVQISTDHFFTGDSNKKHNEAYPIKIVNEYARTKYLAEMLTLTYEQALVVRTNIVGFRYEKSRPTFMEWVIRALKTPANMTLFYDYFTSSIDVVSFSKILFDVIEKRPTGLLNIACREVVSKKAFIQAIAELLGVDLSLACDGSIHEFQGARRAESAGLDVTKAETLLGYRLPSKELVVKSLIKECKMDLL